MKLLEVIRGQVFWKEEFIAHVWDARPFLPPQATEEELAILVQQYQMGGPVPLDLLHRFFFWVRGKEVAGYRPYGPVLGCSPQQVYYLGRPISLEQLEAGGAPALALATHGLNDPQLLGLRVWRLFPQHGLKPRYKFRQVNDLYVVDSEIWDRQGRVLYRVEDRRLSQAMQDWLARHTLEEVRQLGDWRLERWKEWPEVPPGWDNLATWMRDGNRWGFFHNGHQTILVGPGAQEPVRDSLRTLRRLLSAGYLRPNDPTCLCWLKAVSGKSVTTIIDSNAQEVVMPAPHLVAVRYLPVGAVFSHLQSWIVYRAGTTAWEAPSSLTVEEIDLFGQGGYLGVLSSLVKTPLYAYLGMVCGTPLVILEGEDGEDDQCRLAILEPAAEQVSAHVLLTGSLKAIGAMVEQDRHHDQVAVYRLARL